VFVEVLRVEANGAEWNEDEEEPLEFGEWQNPNFKQAELRSVKPEPVRAPKRDDEQKRVNDLEELQIEFLAATEQLSSGAQEQVSSLVLRRMFDPRLEINVAVLPLVAPMLRTLAPLTYQRMRATR